MGNHILVGKFGISLRFHPRHQDNIEFVSSFGADDATKFIVVLAYNNPKDTFYMVGRSDLRDLSQAQYQHLFPNRNLIDVWAGITDATGNMWRWPAQYFKERGITVTGGALFLGVSARYNLLGVSRTLAGELAQPLAFAVRNNAPIINILNETMCPWVALCDDPRSLVAQWDLVNDPVVIASQYNGAFEFQRFDNTTDQRVVDRTVPVRYAGVEYCCTFDEVLPNPEELISTSTKRPIVFGIALNKGADGNGGGRIIQERWPILKEWVLDVFPSAHVYGDWPDDRINMMNDHGQQIYRGKVSRIEIQRIMQTWKTSLCIPIADGWATTKYLEYLKNGVHPFTHPGYDNQKNTQIVDFYRITNPNELQYHVEKIYDQPKLGQLHFIDTWQRCIQPYLTSGASLCGIIYTFLGLRPPTCWTSRDLWTVRDKPTNLTSFF